MARDIDGGDLIRIVNPSGITVNAAWSWLAKVRLISGAVDGRALLKVGADDDETLTRGVFIHFRGTGASNALRVRRATTMDGDTAITTGTWYSIAVTNSGTGTSNVEIAIDGVSDIADNMDALTEITTGDAYSIGYGDTTLGVAVADLEIAMQAWVQGVDLSAAATDTYIDDPCSLIDDYGPSGTVTANALKILLLGDQSTDISGVGQTVSLTGGAEVSGPASYPEECGGSTLAAEAGSVAITGTAATLTGPSFLFAHGAVQWLAADTATTTYTVSGLSFQPKALRFYWVGLQSATDLSSEAINERRGVGFAVSTSARRAIGTFALDGAGTSDCGAAARDDCVACLTNGAGASSGRLDLNAINSDGFQLIVDLQAAGNITVFWEAWGGSDITVAAVGDIAEPAATGDQDYTVTGFVAGATDQVVMLAGCQSTAALNTDAATDSGLHVGFATGSGAAQVTVCGNSDDASTALDTDGYCQDGECLSMIVVAGGNPNARASLTQFGTDNFRLNWAARALTNRRTAFLAIKGGSWASGSYTINGNTGSATATVSGLLFPPKGISLVGRMTAEDTSATSSANDRIGMGSGSSTSSRRSMGILDENATGSSACEINLTVEYDQVLSFPSTAGALQSAYDINAMNSDGFQIIVDTAGGVASEWQGYLAFGATVVSNEVLDAAAGSFAVTGTAATFHVGMPAASGSYAVTGTPATFGLLVPGTPGAFVITGTAADLLVQADPVLIADSGTYSITGTAATFGLGMPAASGTYTVTGTAASLEVGRRLNAQTGTVTITGTAAAAILTVNGTPGEFVITGTAASLEVGRRLVAAAGSYVITGTDAALVVEGASVLLAESGSYTITGTAASLEANRRLSAAAGAYSVTGTAAGLHVTRVLSAASGSYIITGTAANLTSTGVLPLLRIEATLTMAMRLSADLTIGNQLPGG